MTYARELDEIRREARKGVANTFTFWPKVNGANVQATGSSHTFEVFSPTGASIQGPTSVSATDAGTPTVSSFSIAVNAITDLSEDYAVKVLWTATGESVQRVDYFYFDNVLFPFGGPSVSLNDVLEERPDVGEVLDRMGQLLGYASGATAQTNMAAIFAVRARVELEAMVRDQVAQDARAYVPSFQSTSDLYQNGATIYARPNLILNRERLNRVERKLALKLIYAADTTNPEGDDEAAGLLKYYASEASSAWRGVGPLKYDRNEDAIVDSVIEDIGRSVSLRRTQA